MITVSRSARQASIAMPLIRRSERWGKSPVGWVRGEDTGRSGPARAEA